MRVFLLIAFVSLLSACGTAPQRTAAPESGPAELNDAVMYALSLTETPYRWGGNSLESGFDCSGFVGHVYRTSLKIDLPRTSNELSRVGQPMEKWKLRPGDLVFFNTRKRAYSHVGIYVGEGKFVHAPRTGARIRVESMNENYWNSRYNGARRVYF